MAELFGFTIGRAKKSDAKSFVAPSPDDGSLDIGMGSGFFGAYLGTGSEVIPKNDFDLVRKYRQTAEHPECDQAIEDIVNESIVSSENQPSVSISLDYLNYADPIKKKIHNEFLHILKMLHWNERAHEIFKRWYIDGRIYFHKMVDENDPKKGVVELRYIDPKSIRKVREVSKGNTSTTGDLVKKVKEYFLYNEEGIYAGFSGHKTAGQGLKIAADSIVYITSGLYEPTSNQVYSYLHKAIKPVNQLRMIEDAIVIYRISRAPERRIFYIDVGNLPKAKAEQYLKDIMNRYRNKLVYDSSSGEVKDDRNRMSMLEDFWLPRREGGRGTEITTLPGGQNLGELEDIKYFQSKLYRSLNVPISRMESEQGFSLGRSTEITRDEVKFTKFVQKLRKKFTTLFMDILRVQLILKEIITADDWEDMKEVVTFDWIMDNHFSELRDQEVLGDRIEKLDMLQDHIGRYFSHEWVRRNVLKQSEKEIAELDSQIEKEKETMGDDEDSFL